jgi:lipid-A-disaccharide synthase-like uncharacterized protein
MNLFRDTPDIGWVAVGIAAQFLFFGRFLVQWLASEAKRESVIPVSFWYFSLAGGAGLLVYALHKRDLVFILGQAGGLLIYARNVYFIRRKK